MATSTLSPAIDLTRSREANAAQAPSRYERQEPTRSQAEPADGPREARSSNEPNDQERFTSRLESARETSERPAEPESAPASASSDAAASVEDEDASTLEAGLLATLQPLLAPTTHDDPEAVLAELGVIADDGGDGIGQALDMLGLARDAGEPPSQLLANANDNGATHGVALGAVHGNQVHTLPAGTPADTAQQILPTAAPALTNLASSTNAQQRRPGDGTAGVISQDLAAMPSSPTGASIAAALQGLDAQADAETDNGRHQPGAQAALAGLATTQTAATATTSDADGLPILGPSAATPAATPTTAGPAGVAVPERMTAEPNAADRALADQVGRALVRTLSDGQRSLSLRLTPPELGTVRIEIVEQAGRLSVRLGAEDDSVRAALERALPNMRSELRGSSAPITDIRLTDHHLGFNQGREGNGQQGNENGRGHARRNQPTFSLDGQPAEPATTERAAPEVGARVDASGVDGHA